MLAECIVSFTKLCLVVAQGLMYGATSETQTHL